MTLGVVISMKNGYYYLPNQGVLRDLDTGTEYTFHRPATTGTMNVWNVKLHDIVTFTASGTEAVDVALAKKSKDNLVFSYGS